MKQQDNKSSPSQGESTSQHGTDLILQYMKRNSIPLTRENYLELNWPDGTPDPMSVEHEMEMPEMFRLPIQATPMQGNVPPEPKREDFSDEESYWEARSGWQHRIGKVLALRRSMESRKK